VDEHEARIWADSKGFLYFETSAQTGEGVNEMFQVTICIINQFIHKNINIWNG
jgi:GTPase SAR1 family protein